MAKAADKKAGEYQVLARKYRPGTFSELIGQEAMVRTLSNAIKTGRLAHAFVLTGVRGIGKTTTARLIARALNCIGADGKGEVTVSPCGVCDNCLAIAESRHVDVLEMDAASRTGVDDVREIIESVRYAPVSARFKVYIIDEVHMLSKNAFNALLKTLEEPPPHVKFVFATTEIRKLPVTVLSRCQRFDLRRVEGEKLVAHFAKIVKQEGVKVDDEALRLIARAAEGSVRDGLSLLDQAIAHGGGEASAEEVRTMLGLADRAQVLDLFRRIMGGETKLALALFREQYDLGAEPGVILKDLAEVVHWLTRLRVAPEAGSDALVSEAEVKDGREMADKLGMPELTRAWQILLKGIGEVQTAPQPIAAAEMLIIRLCFAADLPSLIEIARSLGKKATGGNKETGSDAGASGSEPHGSAAKAEPAPTADNAAADAPEAVSEPVARAGHEDDRPINHKPGAHDIGAQGSGAQGSGAQVLALAPDSSQDAPPEPMPVSFEAMVNLFEKRREGVLGNYLSDEVELVSYRPGSVVIHPKGRIPPKMASQMRLCLEEWTGSSWQITLDTQTRGAGTLQEKEAAERAELFAEAARDPVVATALEIFDKAKIVEVIDLTALAGEEPIEAVDEEE